MDKQNQKAQYKVMSAISLGCDGAVLGNLLRGYAEGASVEFFLVVIAVGLVGFGLFAMKKI